jgi:hypothetical protein
VIQLAGGGDQGIDWGGQSEPQQNKGDTSLHSGGEGYEAWAAAVEGSDDDGRGKVMMLGFALLTTTYAG